MMKIAAVTVLSTPVHGAVTAGAKHPGLQQLLQQPKEPR
jgi:hypothetical protein